MAVASPSSASVGKCRATTSFLDNLERGEEVPGLEDLLKAINLGDAEFSGVHALLVFVRADKCKEFYVGGVEGCSSLLRVTCEQTDEQPGASHGGGGPALDIICEYCLATTPVTAVACVRKNDALNLIALFWMKFPSSPILVELGESKAYGYVLCGIQGVPETWGPFDLNHWRSLRQRRDDSNVTFMAPKPNPPNRQPQTPALVDDER